MRTTPTLSVSLFRNAFAFVCAGAVSLGCTATDPASDSTGGAGPGDGGPATSTTAPLDSLFTDPSMPVCDDNLNTQYQLVGEIDGSQVRVGTSAASNIDANGFQILDVVAGTVSTPLVLTWGTPLAENVAIPLVGSSIIIPDGQPSAGQTLCITQGKFGSPELVEGTAGRQLLFQITGAKQGDCTGPDVVIALNGCIFRTNPYYPMPRRPDAGVRVTTDAGSS